MCGCCRVKWDCVRFFFVCVCGRESDVRERQLQFEFILPPHLLFLFTSGTMDEVLASLQRGQIQLRKVSCPPTAPSTADVRSNLMTAIRHGVTLKKVRAPHDVITAMMSSGHDVIR